jgi:hypothetical protein
VPKPSSLAICKLPPALLMPPLLLLVLVSVALMASLLSLLRHHVCRIYCRSTWSMLHR